MWQNVCLCAAETELHKIEPQSNRSNRLHTHSLYVLIMVEWLTDDSVVEIHIQRQNPILIYLNGEKSKKNYPLDNEK